MNSTVSAFYIIELHGGATSAVFPGDFGIDKIIIGSKDFPTDIMALGASELIVSMITSSHDVTWEDFSFNPEFFPSVEGPNTDELAARAELEDAAMEAVGYTKESNVIPVLMTRHFDVLGDFVETQHMLGGEGFTVVSKVAMSPQVYLDNKKKETQSARDIAKAYRPERNIAIH